MNRLLFLVIPILAFVSYVILTSKPLNINDFIGHHSEGSFQSMVLEADKIESRELFGSKEYVLKNFKIRTCMHKSISMDIELETRHNSAKFKATNIVASHDMNIAGVHLRANERVQMSFEGTLVKEGRGFKIRGLEIVFDEGASCQGEF